MSQKTLNTGRRLRWRSVALGAALALSAACSTSIHAQTALAQLSGHVPMVVRSGQVSRIGPVSAEQHLHLAFQLPLRNRDDLNSFLQRLYDANSSDFHHYLSVEDFTEKYGPSKTDYHAVVSFVQAHGMTVLDTPRNRMLVEADGTVAQVNSALHVTITEYQDPTEKRKFLAPDREPSLETNVPIRHVSGLDTFQPPRARLTLNTKATRDNSPRANASSSTYPPNPTGSGPYSSYIPSDFRAAYYGNGPLDGSGQTIGLVEFDGFDQVDLNNFYSTIGVQQNVPINVVLLGGLTAPMGDGGNDAEPILDITYALSMAPHVSQVRVYECCSATYNGSASGPTVILNSIASENIAKQTSCSWGWGPELSVHDPIYQEMAAQGQTFFAATGDYGSPQNPGNDTYDDYSPADDAYVTAVSMSLVTTNGAGGSWAADIYAGGAGGGYSDGPTPVPLPSYQAGIANASNQASTSFRNMPDVVIDGYGSFLCGGSNATNTHQCFPNAGCTTCTNGGSSMSAPIWASYMALVNEEAANEGKPPIGFLNPALYLIAKGSRYASDFHDIIGGSNNCCGQNYAYTAVPGFDLVSGWGTPSGTNLMTDLLSQGSAFSLLLSASALTIGPSDSASVEVSVEPSSGFNGGVTLSVVGLPSGVTASFNANPTAQDSTLTLTSNSSAQPKSYALTITGTAGAGSLSASTTVVLTVTATQGNFTVGSTLTATAIQGGTSVAPTTDNPNTITVTSVDNFSGTVNLALHSAPAGMTATFDPPSVTLSSDTTANSVMTLTASTTTATGPATAMISGASGSLTSGVPLLLSITPSFAVTATSASLSVTQGHTAVTQVSVLSQNGFNSAVTLSTGSLPSGVTASFSPTTVTPAGNSSATSMLTLTAASSAALASTSTTIIATSGAAVANEPISVTVTPPPPATFSLSAAPSFVTLTGGSATVSVTVASQNGFASSVNMNVSGLPTGVTATVAPGTVQLTAGNTAVVTVTLTSGTASAKRENPFSGAPLAALTVLLLPITRCFKRKRRHIRSAWILSAALFALLAGAVSCSSPGQATPPAQSTTVTVTGVSGTITSTTTFTVSVQ